MENVQNAEETFYSRAGEFLSQRLAGVELGLDTNLLEAGMLDSLLVVEFFLFLEEQRGRPIDSTTFTTEKIATLRRAYEFVSSN